MSIAIYKNFENIVLYFSATKNTTI